MKNYFLAGACALFCGVNTSLPLTFTDLKTPKLTVVMVIDQMAHHYLNTIAKHFQHGFKYLLDGGVVYDSAYMMHGIPSTGPGHASLNTGAYPKDHGIIGNSWRDLDNKKTACDDDSPDVAAVISPTGFYPYGKSSHNVMVGGISDSFGACTSPDVPHHVYAISAKSRSSICAANKIGKAIWFDLLSGQFTSSKFYFPDGVLPEWVTEFNQTSGINAMQSYTWDLAYKRNKRPYNFFESENYTFSRPQKTFVGATQTKEPGKNIDFYGYLEKTPQMAENIFGLAKKCITAHVDRKKKDQMLLWVLIGNLDKIGHTFGCSSLEAMDTLYHLDRQIGEFMKFAQRRVGKENALFVLTADHGMALTPEIAHRKGLVASQRVGRKDLMAELDDLVQELHVSKDLISSISGPNVYINHPEIAQLAADKQDGICQRIKHALLQKPYIKSAWTYNELKNADFCCGSDIECAFKNQLYPGRSGAVIFRVQPNNFVTRYDKGADHKTPYEMDTHIPLIFYQAGRFEGKVITQRVRAQQVASTLSTILRVPKPDACTADVLPGLFKE